MNCRVVVEAAVPVYDVESPDEAVRIAISKTGEMLNPDLNYVEIDMGERSCPHCGEHLETAFIAADEGLVALELEMTVFNVEREEHASRIARKEIGQCLENIPLEVLEVEVVEDDATDESDAAAADDGSGETSDDAGEVEDASTDAADAGAADAAGSDDPNDERPRERGDVDETDDVDDGRSDAGDEGSDDEETTDDEVLPEFEDLIE